jgi:hypothetical protein
MTFKEDIHAICHEVASEFEDWTFVPSLGAFKNKTLKHTDLLVAPGFYFKAGLSTSVQPCACVMNKKVAKLFIELFGYDAQMVSIIQFQSESSVYRSPGRVSAIFPEEGPFTNSQGVPQPWPSHFIVTAQAKDYLRQVLTDGIRYLHKYFNFTSEEALLRNLPVRLRDREPALEELLKGWGDQYYENISGILHCLAAIVVGNFDFVERYASDDFKTITPKRETELQKIMAALPEFKRKFAATGKVI